MECLFYLAKPTGKGAYCKGSQGKQKKKKQKRHKTEKAKKKKTLTDKITPHKIKDKTFNRGLNIRDRIEQ